MTTPWAPASSYGSTAGQSTNDPEGERADSRPTPAAPQPSAGPGAPQVQSPQGEGPADLRLVAPALAAWGAAALALDAPVRPLLLFCAAALVLAGLAVLRAVRRRAAGPAASPEPGPRPRTGLLRSGWRRRRTAWDAGTLVAAAAVLLCAVGGAAAAALQGADLRRGPVPRLAHQYAQATVELEVTEDPHLARQRVRGAQRMPAAVVFAADVRRITAPDGTVTALRTPVLVIVPQHRPQPDRTPRTGDGQDGREHTHSTAQAPDSAATGPWRALLPSTRIRVGARLAPPLPPTDRVAAVLRVAADAADSPPRRIGGPTSLQRLAGFLRGGLREASDGLRPDARALLPGLVVGDTSRLTPELDDAFRATDLTHLLAVSGSNLTIVLALLIGPPQLAIRAERRGIAPRLGLSLRTTALIGGAVALAFVVVCRPDPSVLRAAACGLITLLAIGSGRRRTLLPALAAAVLLLVLYDPWLARSYGFLLSVLATGALLTLAPRWSAALQRRRVPPRLAEVIAAAAAAQAVCAPVIAVLAARVGLMAIPCNLLAELAVAPATVLGFAALATAPLLPPLAIAFAWCGGWPAEWIAAIARTGAALPGAEFGWPGGWAGGFLLAAVITALVPVARVLLRYRWLCVVCALLLVVLVVRPVPLTRIITGWPPPGWRLAVCDVGQGDGLVVATGPGSALVVDTGPDPRAMDRCLQELGVRRIPLLVLTHFHADHVDGLPGALRGRSVGTLETTTREDPPDQAAFVRKVAADHDVPEIRAVPGERRRAGAVSWEVLWPPQPSPVPPQLPALASAPAARPAMRTATGSPPPVPSTGPMPEGPNNASVTLLVHTAGLTVLLLGDLEPPAQQELLAAHPGLRAIDVLKVAHHGSAYQDPALLRALAPRLALISVGAGNPYGHPAPSTVAALRVQGARVLRTDTDGAIAVTGSVTTGLAAATSNGRRRRPVRGGQRPARRRVAVRDGIRRPTGSGRRRRARVCTSA
ncbi:ComEC/Rec2 family competence protein [Streptomyces ochraceiscleroticus]|uniref:ComEC/Rec2 family competence protein n=1 Tax=Streptomyces ochraceiscleroticus TaxID=47761 RepID=A0ABW1MF56_9ACTN|nr:ComEC/Rec2 family competence protein [Streptomyces ochraceiscleroticus]